MDVEKKRKIKLNQAAREKIITIRAQIKEIKNKKRQRKPIQQRSGSSKKISEIDKPLARLNRKEREHSVPVL